MLIHARLQIDDKDAETIDLKHSGQPAVFMPGLLLCAGFTALACSEILPLGISCTIHCTVSS